MVEFRCPRSKRSAADQLAALDFRLGKGRGAKRERARLLSIVTEEKAAQTKIEATRKAKPQKEKR